MLSHHGAYIQAGIISNIPHSHLVRLDYQWTASYIYYHWNF